MLKSVTIQDLAVIRHLDLEFKPGLTVITGETGAGKSIVIDALGLVLGDRADTEMVRIGSERANISAVFDVSTLGALQEYLRQHDLGEDTECVLRRTIGADGRSRAFCNQTPVTLATLKEIGAWLLDIHGQHEHHSLLQRPVQRALLDEFGRHQALLHNCRDTYAQWAQATAELAELRGNVTDVAGRAEFLRFQLQELATIKLDAATLTELETEHRRLSHTQKLREGAESISNRVFGGERSALRQLTIAQHQIAELATLDPSLKNAGELFDQVLVILTEAEHELTAYHRALANEDPTGLAKIERQFERLHDLARKFRCEPGGLADLATRFADELAQLEGREQREQQLAKAIAQNLERYTVAAGVLSNARKACAETLARTTTKILRELGMPHAQFSVDIGAAPHPASEGSDEIEFLLTTNADQPARALRKVASGGELSRSSLAIQVATAGVAQLPTLIYDEVDTGIGGRVAGAVAAHLQTLARERQVLCITHLPQVASAGDHHLLITKAAEKGVTATAADYLDSAARIEEIAKMLGGAEPTAKSRAHARELLST